MNIKLNTYCIIVLAIILFPLSSVAQKMDYSNIFYNSKYSSLYIATDEDEQQDNDRPFTEMSVSLFSINSPWTGKLVQPFGDILEPKQQIIEKESKRKLPNGTDTAELLPVGDGMLIIFLVLMFFIGVRMGRKESQCD